MASLRRRLLPDILIIAGLFLLAMLFFAPATLGGQTIIPADNLYQYAPWTAHREAVGVPDVPHNALLSDLVLQNYQWKQFIRANLSEREIPLWQPNMLGGSPFLANGQHSLLYPFSLIYYVLPLSAAFGWFTVSQLWLAGTLMYLYIRGIGLGRMAGAVAALTVTFSSFFVVATVHPMIQAGAAWLPLLLLMIEFTLAGRPFPGTGGQPARLPWVLIGGVGLGMVHLAGHLEITYYTLLVMAVYAGLRLLSAGLRGQRPRALLGTGLLLAGMVALGFGIGAVQFIPNVEAASNSFRTSRPDDSLATVRGYALPPRHVAKFLMPNVYGNPAHHDYIDVFSGQTVQHDWTRPNPASPDNPIRTTNTDFGIKNYVEGGAYVGLLPLLLAALGLAGGLIAGRNAPWADRPPYRLIFGVIALLSLSFAFGTPAYAVLYYGLPGIEQLHTPFRWLWPLTICLAVLAACGVEVLRHQARERRLGRLVRALGGSAVLGGLGVLLALVASRLFYQEATPLLSRVYEGLAGASGAFPDLRSFYSYQFWNVLLFGGVLLAAGGILLISRRGWTVGRGLFKTPLWQAAALALIVGDLFLATAAFPTYADPAWLDFTPPSVAWLQDKMAEEEAPFRVQSYSWGADPLHANAGWRYSLHDVRGYDSLFSREYAALMDDIVPQDGLDFNRIVPIRAWLYPEAAADPLLDYLNVRYLLTDWLMPDPARLGYREVYSGAGMRIYENLNVLPRAYTVPHSALDAAEDCWTAAGDAVQLPAQTTPGFIPPDRGQCTPVQAATITRYQDTEVWVDATIDEPAWLVLADNHAPGWRAFLRPIDGTQDDEVRLDIERVNGNLRGVRLDEPGVWTVRFDYSPASFQLGGFLTFISGMLVIFLALIWAWRMFVSEAADQDTGRRLAKNSLAPIFLNLFNRGIDFAFAFIMLRILGPADAGIYYYAIVVFGWFDIFTNFGLNTLLTREVSREPSSAGRYLFNTSLLRIGLALLGIPALAGVLYLRNATVTPSLDMTAVIAIGLLYIGLIPNSISTGLSALFYAFEKAEFPAAIATVTTMVKVTAGLAALLLGWGVIGLAGASIITNLVTLLIMGRLAWPLVRANWEPVPDSRLQRFMMRESWPLMINHLLATVFFKSDVILMEAINGVRIVGIYSTSYKWLDALNIIPAFFTMALLPVMSRQAHNDRAALRRNYILGIKLLVMVALPVAVATLFIARLLINLLGGPEFLPEGAIALQIMIWSIPLGWMNSLTQYVLIALDRQRQITGAFIGAVGFNVIANLIFLPAFSFRAAAITTIVSELVLLVGFYVLLREPLGAIHWGRVLWRPWLAAGAMLAVLAGLWPIMPGAALLLSGAVYLGVLWALQPFDQAEADRLAPLLPARLRSIVLRRPVQSTSV